MINNELAEHYKTKAQAVGCVVTEYNNAIEAIPYLVKLLKEKKPCELLDDTGIDDAEKGQLSPNGVPTRIKPVIASPFTITPFVPKANAVDDTNCANMLDENFYSRLKEEVEKENCLCIDRGLRKYLAGIDVGILEAMYGIAESGTCMLDTNNEDVRLSSMIAEICVIILKKSTIKPTVLSIAQEMRNQINKTQASYTTLMSGPSRTADIERVGAVGVHGSLEVHIILLDC